MRRPPKSVTIAGWEIPIRYIDLEGKWADYDEDKRRINLCLELKKDPARAWIFLLHEMHHAALSLAGLGEVLGKKREEAVVRNFERVMIPAMLSLDIPRLLTGRE